MNRITTVCLLAVSLLAGCVVPPGGFDDDGSGVSVYPAPGEMIREGDVVVIRNQSGEDVSCGSTYLLFDPSRDGADVPDGSQAEIVLDYPRDVNEDTDASLRGWVRFNCASADQYTVWREWQYGSPI